MLFSPRGDRLVSSGADGGVRLWDVPSGKEIRRWNRPTRSWCRPLTFSADGTIQFLLAPAATSALQVWTVDAAKDATDEAGRGFRKLPGEHRDLRAAALSPDGKTLAVACSTDGFSLWDPTTGHQIRRLATSNEADNAPVQAEALTGLTLNFLPDGRTLLASSPSFVRMWDVSTGRLRPPFLSDAAGDLVLAVSPDGRTLVTGGPDIRLWELATGKERLRLDGHAGGTTRCVTFAPDGRTLASGGADTTALVWDLTNGRGKKSRDLRALDLEAAWKGLADDDAAGAYQAILDLVDAPQAAVSLLHARLKPVRTTPPIKELIADLDSEDFFARDQAMRELAELGEIAEPALLDALRGKPPLELHRRVEGLLKRLETTVLTREERRVIRAVEALGMIGTPEAEKILRDLAQGAPLARRTREAKAALERIGAR